MRKKLVRVFTRFGWTVVFAFVCLRTARRSAGERKASPKWRHRMKEKIWPWMPGNRRTVKCERWRRSMVASLTCSASAMMTVMMDMVSNNSPYAEVSGMWAVNSIHSQRIFLETHNWFPYVRNIVAQHDEHADDLISIRLLRCRRMIPADSCVILGIRNWTMALHSVCKM